MKINLIQRLTRTAAIIAVAYPSLHSLAFAGGAGPFGVGTPDAQGMRFYSGPLSGFFLWVAQQQLAFYTLLTDALDEFKGDSHASLLLIGISFAYGVFHAVGPGHGKAVITSYLLASRQTAKHGILLSFGAAFMQGVVAILIISLIAIILKSTATTITAASTGLQVASFAMIAVLGGWLLWKKVRERGWQEVPANGEAPALDHGASARVASCPRQVWSTILAVGIRPCTGALIVLAFALHVKLYFAGIVSVLAISLGTAITVSLLVVLAVSARAVALRYADSGSRIIIRALYAVEILLALFVFLFGSILFIGAAVRVFAV